MNYEDVIQKLRKSGKKITPQRVEIIKTIIELKSNHPSLIEILEKVSEKLPTTSVSTVYNTIQELEEMGVIRTFDLNRETRIEANIKPHINLVYRDGRVVDLDDEEIVERITERLKLKDILINIHVF